MSDPQRQEEKNEVIAHRFHTDIFQKGDLSADDQILAENFVWRNPNVPSELAHGPEGVKKIASAARDLCQILILHMTLLCPKATKF